jgi:hypothetical protein
MFPNGWIFEYSGSQCVRLNKRIFVVTTCSDVKKDGVRLELGGRVPELGLCIQQKAVLDKIRLSCHSTHIHACIYRGFTANIYGFLLFLCLA